MPLDPKKLRKMIMEELTVPLWPHAGQALGYGRNTTYGAAKDNKIETLSMGRTKPVPTSFLRRKLGLPEPNTK